MLALLLFLKVSICCSVKTKHKLQRSNSYQYGIRGIINLIVILFSSVMNTDSTGLWVEDQALNYWLHTANYLPCCFSSKWVTENQNSPQNPESCQRSIFVLKLKRSHCINSVDDTPSSTGCTYYRSPNRPLGLEQKNNCVSKKTRQWTNKTD